MSTVVLRLALRRLLYRRRTILLVLAGLLPTLVALLYRLETPPRESGFEDVMGQIFLPYVLPFVALVIGASAIGEERDDGTILYLASTPLRRLAIVLPLLAAAALTTLVICVPGFVGCLALAPGTNGISTVAWGLAAVAGAALAYTGLFGWLSLRAPRPVVLGMLYIVIWEGSITAFAPSARWLSVQSYARATIAGGLPGGKTSLNAPDLAPVLALCVLAAGTAIWLLMTARRFNRVELP